jgi:hypothetical protein
MERGLGNVSKSFQKSTGQMTQNPWRPPESVCELRWILTAPVQPYLTFRKVTADSQVAEKSEKAVIPNPLQG